VIDLVLLGARLFLEHVALDVVARAAHLDAHGTGAPLVARELQLALGLALERDLAWRAIAAGILAAMRATQVREEFQLRIVGNARVGSGHLDARLVELRQQPVDRHLQHLGKLRNGHFRHKLRFLVGISYRPRTTAHAPS